MERLLLRVDEAAASLGIAPSRVWAMIANGQIRSVQLGRSRRIPADALREFVEALPDARKPDS